MKNLAVLGPKGTFSDEAANRYISKNNINITKTYYDTIDDVVYSLQSDCNMCIVPVENTLAGYVQKTLDLLLEMSITIVNEIFIPVQFSLISNVKEISEIKNTFVQFKTREQCTNIIKELKNSHIITTESNMESYEKYINGKVGDSAIIPKHIFSSNENNFGVTNVTDSSNNTTRFLILTKSQDYKTEINKKKDIKVSLYVLNASHKPGVLFGILKVFSENNVNLISIMSKPTKKELGSYNFFIELNGKIKEKENILRTLEVLKLKYKIKILGIY
ncbi:MULTISPECIES: prephenate dehydratase [Clostridium]|nr:MULTISPECIES: prephenate dehydratase domain-containing protein [Clostridium]KEH84776.1 prephenate dehydratase [Clostridium novyi A str. NCTC 538]KEH84788.1 prephenate dehydratase [Clostridium novyi A str. 4540]KEH91935.1 prephenate dehydratase [Clostridium botulinum C/D str. It1]